MGREWAVIGGWPSVCCLVCLVSLLEAIARSGGGRQQGLKNEVQSWKTQNRVSGHDDSELTILCQLHSLRARNTFLTGTQDRDLVIVGRPFHLQRHGEPGEQTATRF